MRNSFLIPALAATAILLNACGAPQDSGGHSAIFTNATYWQEFFGPGEMAVVSVASVSGGAVPDARTPQRVQDAGSAALNENVAAMKGLYSQSNGFIRSFPAVEQRYGTIIDRMTKGIGGKIAGKALSDPDRRTITLAISQASGALDSQNARIQAAKSSFEQAAAPVLDRANRLEKNCTSADPAETSQLSRDCPMFLNSLSLFRVRMEVTSKGFEHVNDVYAESRKKQADAAREFNVN